MNNFEIEFEFRQNLGGGGGSGGGGLLQHISDGGVRAKP